jgi:hypothetical protein
MKRLFLLLLFSAFIFSGSHAQERTKMRPADRFIFGIFTDIWSGLPGDLKQQSINRGVNIEYLQDFPMGTTNFSLAAGLGFTGHNMYSDHIYYDEARTGNHEFIPVADVYSSDYRNNKISLNYLNVPLELRYRSRNLPQTFRIHAGIRAGWLVSGHTKYVGEIIPGGRQTLQKEKKLSNVENFLIGFQGKMGYGRYNLNTYLSLTDIFTDNNASGASVFSLGISFILF